MTNLKYAVVERERRWLLSRAPDLTGADAVQIRDRYVVGSRLRLREVTAADGTTVRKLNHKVRLTPDASEVANTSIYLDDAEWRLLVALGSTVLEKARFRLTTPERMVAVDVFAGACLGLVVAEADGGEALPPDLPPGWPVLAEVTADEDFAGASLATASHSEVRARAARYGLTLP
jgi:CYTH domain-containing protein